MRVRVKAKGGSRGWSPPGYWREKGTQRYGRRRRRRRRMKSFLFFSKQARARDLRAFPTVRVDPVAITVSPTLGGSLPGLHNGGCRGHQVAPGVHTVPP